MLELANQGLIRLVRGRHSRGNDAPSYIKTETKVTQPNSSDSDLSNDTKLYYVVVKYFSIMATLRGEVFGEYTPRV